MVEYLRVFCHVGFFLRSLRERQIHDVVIDTKDELHERLPNQRWHSRSPKWRSPTKRSGRATRPASVTVVLSEDTLVITLHDALTPAEKALALSPAGAAQVQEFHRQLFLTSADSLRKEIKRITGREVREAAAEVEPATGTVVHAFTTGNVVQVYRLDGRAPADAFAGNGSRNAA